MQKKVLVAFQEGITKFHSLNEAGEIIKTVNIPAIINSDALKGFELFPARMLPTQGIDITSTLSLQMLSKLNSRLGSGEISSIIGGLAMDGNPCFTDTGVGRGVYLASLEDISRNKAIKDQPIPIVHVTAFPNGAHPGLRIRTAYITICPTEIKVHIKAKSDGAPDLMALIRKGNLFKIM